MPSGPGVIAEALIAEVAAALREEPVRTFLLTAHTDAEAIAALFADLVTEHGRLDAVVNVAGITRPTGFASGTDEDWAAVLSVHLDGYRNVLAAALPIMAEAVSKAYAARLEILKSMAATLPAPRTDGAAIQAGVKILYIGGTPDYTEP